MCDDSLVLLRDVLCEASDKLGVRHGDELRRTGELLLVAPGPATNDNLLAVVADDAAVPDASTDRVGDVVFEGMPGGRALGGVDMPG